MSSHFIHSEAIKVSSVNFSPRSTRLNHRLAHRQQRNSQTSSASPSLPHASPKRPAKPLRMSTTCCTTCAINFITNQTGARERERFMAGFALLRRLISFARCCARLRLGMTRATLRGAPAIMRHNQLVPTCFAAPLASLAECKWKWKISNTCRSRIVNRDNLHFMLIAELKSELI
jgi:hypothetical protein